MKKQALALCILALAGCSQSPPPQHTTKCEQVSPDAALFVKGSVTAQAQEQAWQVARMYPGHEVQVFRSVLHVAYTLACEAKSNPPEEALRDIASVIYNRAKDGGNSFMDVIHKPYAFSCWGSNGWRQIAPVAGHFIKTFERATLISVEMHMPDDPFRPTVKADHYFAPAGVKRWPKWAKKMKLVKVAHGHRFYRSK